ncbi:hypothetical protein, partial [Escherichia coli]|uniref:hypothetical protein n=1 Tax=Escherichia coli TaxID=562 RepID=UPI0013B0059F
TIDVPGEKMNTLKAEFASQVRAIIKQLRENKELRGVVFVSAKHPQPLPGATFEQSKPSNLPKLYSKPACLSAALTVSRPLSV